MEELVGAELVMEELVIQGPLVLELVDVELVEALWDESGALHTSQYSEVGWMGEPGEDSEDGQATCTVDARPLEALRDVDMPSQAPQDSGVVNSGEGVQVQLPVLV